METTMWITKNEPSETTPCAGSSAVCSEGMMYNGEYVDQQFSYNHRFQQQHQSSGGYGPDLDNLQFSLEDFLVVNNGQCERPAFPQSSIKLEQGQMKQDMLDTHPPMSLLHVRTEEMMNTGCSTSPYECQSPDSGINADAGMSTNTDYGRSFSHVSSADIGPSRSLTSFITSATCDQGPWGQTDVGLEIYHDLIMRHLVQDIKATSVRLSIPQDPKQWTSSDCRSWLTDMAAQYHLTQVPYENFDVDGSKLCSMSLTQFAQRFPNGGETVHAQLQIWISANDYCRRQANIAKATMGLDGTNVALSDPCFQSIQSASLQAASQQQQQEEAQLTAAYAQMYQYHQPEQMTSSAYSLSTLLPSPGSCSDSGISNDFESNDEPPLSGSSHAPNSNNIHLWQFLRELLEQHEKYSHCVRWVDRSAGIFKIEDSHKLAKLWGQRKNRPAMNYDKLSRSLRQYYKKNILKKTARSQRLVYQFLHPFHMC